MIEGIIFDLDGVIVSTDECHYRAWKRMADEVNIFFDRAINERLRGVSRMESLEIILENSPKIYSSEEKNSLSDRKNRYYREQIGNLSEDNILPGVSELLTRCRRAGKKIAVGSSSKNTKLILERIGLTETFDAVVDGNDIVRSKPDPEVFLKAAQAIGVAPEQCLVVEDAESGVQAGISAGMRVLGVGSASKCEKATDHATSLADEESDRLFSAVLSDRF